MTAGIAVQKIIAGIATMLAVTQFAPPQILLLFIVFGHAHFIAAYYYQWRAGKWGLRGALTFLMSAATLVGITIYTDTLEQLVLVSSIIFFIHHFQDEVLLWGKERSIYRTLEQATPVLLYSSIATDLLFNTTLTPYAIMVGALLWIGRIYLHARDARKTDILTLYFATWSIGLAGVYGYTESMAPEAFIGSIILFHYLSWLVYYYYKLAPSQERQWSYCIDMLVIHGIVCGLFAITMYSTVGYTLVGFLFAPHVFYTSAILHILFSLRVADYKQAFIW